MPPKKRVGIDDNGVQKKRRKKKQAELDYDDDDDDSEEEINDTKTGNGAPAYLEEYANFKLEPPMTSGEVLFCGATNWDMVGRSNPPKGTKNIGGPNLMGPHRLGVMCGLKVRSVISSSTSCHSVIVTEEGKTYTWGRNEKGQLGHGDTARRDVPTLVEGLTGYNIVDAACGKQHTIFLTDQGKTLSCGDNKMGQLGLNHQSPSNPSPTRLNYTGPPIRKVACGGEFSMISDIRGNLYSFGCPEYGQLGNNSDGKFFVTSNKLTFKCELVPHKVHVFIQKSHDGHIMPVTDVEVRDIACGHNHTVILDSQKRLFTWGFGGYGRLGHSEPKDELVPRLVKYFSDFQRGITQINAGGAFTMGVQETGILYCWGQTKPTGEAAMYPKIVQDLCGWKVRDMGCSNRSIVVAADASIVSWGPSPTFGELGYGENKPKSSTVPQEVKTLDSLYIHKVTCGMAHTLFIARSDTEEDEKALAKIPIFKDVKPVKDEA